MKKDEERDSQLEEENASGNQKIDFPEGQYLCSRMPSTRRGAPRAVIDKMGYGKKPQNVDLPESTMVNKRRLSSMISKTRKKEEIKFQGPPRKNASV